MNNILLVGAHYDDVELGCAGVAARFAEEGKNVYKLTLTDNVTDFKQMNIQVDEETSIADSAKACKVLGINEITDFKTVPCNYLTYDTKVMQAIEAIIFDKNIDTVFMHFFSDMNTDHSAASQICMTAARHCKNLIYYQSNGYLLAEPYYPTLFFDITNQYEKRREALNQYGCMHNRYSRLFEMSMERTSVWGYANRVKYAEGFVPVKLTF